MASTTRCFRSLSGAASLATIVATVLTALPARAQTVPACSSLPNPVVIALGQTQEPLIKNIGQKLRNASDPAARMTLIYRTQGSCANIAAIYAKDTTPFTQTMLYIPSTEEDPSWTPEKAAPSCSPGAGIVPDITNSNAFISACDSTPTPSYVGVNEAAIQAYGFIVPKASSQTAITAEEGYFVFGYGNTGGVTPWVDKDSMYILENTRSTLISTMAAVNVPRERASGVRIGPSEVINAVATSTNPEKTIGLAGIELYDAQRDKLKVLAFQAFGQKHAYFPDMKATSFDKNNLRIGLYFPWSPTIYMTKVDPATKEVVSVDADRAKRARYLIDILQGKAVSPAPGFESLDLALKAGLVPRCAMKVTREVEGGPLASYAPEEPCHCYYESKYPDSYKSQCTKCTDDTTCGGGKCRHGFCEAK
jgi:hypothetical protein